MTVISTGRALTIEVNSIAYTAQATEIALIANNNETNYTTCDGTVTPVASPANFQLRIRGFQDYGAAVSFCDAMWTAAAAGTAIPFEFVYDAATNRTWTGNVLPQYVSAGGAADAALEFDQTFSIVGTPTKA